jgi:hypothetical protein
VRNQGLFFEGEIVGDESIAARLDSFPDHNRFSRRDIAMAQAASTRPMAE